jgi:hypothetical protein
MRLGGAVIPRKPILQPIFIKVIFGIHFEPHTPGAPSKLASFGEFRWV